jgi:hypothetical protein
MHLAFSVVVESTEDFDEESIAELKKSKEYNEYKRWFKAKNFGVIDYDDDNNDENNDIKNAIPEKLSTNLSPVDEDGLEDPTLYFSFSQHGNVASMKRGAVGKKPDASAASITSNNRLINIQSLIRRLNLNPSSYLYHGINYSQSEVWMRYLINNVAKTVTFEIDSDVIGGIETEQMLKEKCWLVPWESELYSKQVNGIYPKKNAFPPVADNEVFLKSPIVDRNKESTNETAKAVHAMAESVKELAGTTIKGTTFINFKRDYSNCFVEKDSYSCSVKLVNGPESLMIDNLTNMRIRQESVYARLLAVGSLKGKDYEVLFSILTKPSPSTRSFTSAQFKELKVEDVLNDRDVLAPLTVVIEIAEKKVECVIDDAADI